MIDLYLVGCNSIRLYFSPIGLGLELSNDESRGLLHKSHETGAGRCEVSVDDQACWMFWVAHYLLKEDMMRFISLFLRICMTLASASALFTISPAYATVYFEVGDAGTSAATAEYIPWQTTTIAGALHDYDGADVYGFEWGGGSFLADTVGSGFDTMLSLFDQSGSLLTFNDDFGGPLSQISLTLGSGNYFLGITYYPNNYQGDMQYYLGTGIEASYQINKSISQPISEQLQGNAASFINDIPEPASIALIGIGLAGIMLNRRFKKYVT